MWKLVCHCISASLESERESSKFVEKNVRHSRNWSDEKVNFPSVLKKIFFSGETFPQISEKIDENSHPNAFARLRTLSTTEQKSPKCALTKNGNIPKLWMCLFGGKKLLMLIKIFLSYDEQIFRFSSTSSLLLFQIDACWILQNKLWIKINSKSGW